MLDCIIPQWPAPEWVKAVITTRQGGHSLIPYASLNLGDHVGDDPERVRENRKLLAAEIGLPAQPLWLQQVHGCDVALCGEDVGGRRADASTAMEPGQVCVVLTADCLPLLMCNRSGTRVAAVHAGWRGLAAGVVEAALNCFSDPLDELLVWLGPAIGPQAFEVGDEVRELFVQVAEESEAGFTRNGTGRWLADLYFLARVRLNANRLGFVGGGNYCTFAERERFFSYRRDGVTGRTASMIWIEPR